MLDSGERAWLRRHFGAGIRFDEPMAEHTSFKIGGPADVWVQPEDETELSAVLKWSQKRDISYLVIGGGTNLLVRDGGIRGLVIHLGRLAAEVTWASQGGQIHLTAGAGVPTKRICTLALKHGWQGMNFALGIPGTFGGAIIMNAGTAHGSVADVIDSVTMMTSSGEKMELQRKSLAYRYRQLQLPEGISGTAASAAIVLGVNMTLHQGDRAQTVKEARKWMQDRSSKQPVWQPSAGCFFKNPARDLPAGRLIDDVGLKGWQVGGAQVSTRHANYIINRGGARAADVLAVAIKIQETVKSRFNIDLIPEVRIVGEEKTSA